MALPMPLFDYSLWILFSLFVGIALALDLGLLTKFTSIIKTRRKYSDILDNKSKQKEYQDKDFDPKIMNTEKQPLYSDQSPQDVISGSAGDTDTKKYDDQDDTRKSTTFKHALHWTIVWISLAIVFAGIIYVMQGYENALLFLTGYAIEKSLSMDNMFVFLIIFSSLGIPYAFQHKVLMVGIISAIGMRIVLILAGISLLETFHWMVYIFGGLLLFTAIRMIVEKKEKKIEIEKNIAVRILKKFLPITPELHGNKFMIRKKSDLDKITTYATPMLVALIIVEATDLVFALDSIPAILAITTDTFIVITSNLFAILGLRSLYFLLAGMMDKFYYLKPGLAAILAFVGIKIIISDYFKIPLPISISIIFGILAVVVILSTLRSRNIKREQKIS